MAVEEEEAVVVAELAAGEYGSLGSVKSLETSSSAHSLLQRLTAPLMWLASLSPGHWHTHGARDVHVQLDHALSLCAGANASNAASVSIS